MCKLCHFEMDTTKAKAEYERFRDFVNRGPFMPNPNVVKDHPELATVLLISIQRTNAISQNSSDGVTGDRGVK
jgi:hypothetical protein